MAVAAVALLCGCIPKTPPPPGASVGLMTMTGQTGSGPLTMTHETWVSPAVVEPGSLPADGVKVDVYQVNVIRGQRGPEPPGCSNLTLPRHTTAIAGTYGLQRPTPPTVGDFTPAVTIAPVTGVETSQQRFVCTPGSYDQHTTMHREVTIPQATLAAMDPGCYQFLGYDSHLAGSVSGDLATLEIGAGSCSTT